eukprot:TRINITY_DN11459_c0_g1_i1.p1 TRINITY_DN11459_c0_g1~~TRINITY_DN11459_c0_g1_i1.p1  ORF type:complete len:1431 (-),score=227.73 TRINITY_DN11459_c0_g1_i1:552-4844(-)
MFQKHSIMSLKKKSKSLGHLTALGSHPCSPDVEPKLKKNGSSAKFNMVEAVQPTAAKYMKRFLSPTSQDRQPLPTKQPPLISSPMNMVRSNKIDKQLQTRNKTTPKKLKGVMKGKGGGGGAINPVAMGKALIAKANFTPSKNGGNFSGRSGEGLADIFTSKDGAFVPNKHRAFLMDTQVKYTIGLQSQERNLFLFNDLLLIAKERSSSHFKLKDQVPLSDVWLSNCISDVSEVTLDPFTSFVIGWPISNAVITFSSSAQKELWWEKLRELIAIERSHSPAGASINITYFDNATNFEHLKSIYVAISDCSRDCIQKALDCLELGDGGKEPGEFQLWVRTKLDESPYPLIGHEIPLVIKLHWMRQTFNNKNQKTYDEYRQGCRCSFILRKVGQVSNFNEIGSQKKKLKKVKSSMKLQNVFRRVSQGSRTADTTDGAEDKKLGQLFGRSLCDLCGGDGQTNLPQPVVAMLEELDEKGPITVGIFRRGPNVRAMRDLRDKLDEGEEVDWSEISVFVTAALLKDLLRSLPDCLLQCDNYSAWAEATSLYPTDKNIDMLKSHVERLPPANNYLLKHLLYILNKTAVNNQENMMTASNLSICVGPSLIWTHDQNYMLDQNYSKEVSALIQILIEDYEKLYGSETPELFCKPAETKSEIIEVGVGAAGGPAERTSSLSSSEKGQPINKQTKSALFDHSSLDSLLDPAYPEDDLARQSGTEGVSLTNLSHDSGLTTSDSQLYAFEEPENNSFSSDDFCIETITSNDNTVHAIVNKKFLSRYQNSYLVQGGDYPLPGQVPELHHHHHGNSPSRRKVNQRHQKHRDRMHRRIHRNSDYGGYSSSKAEVIEPAAYNYDVRTSKINFPLRRTASEESVQHTSNFEIIHVNNNNRRKRPAAHRKGKAPNPPRGSKTSPNIVRSNSVNQVRHWEQSMDWYRSKSTTRLNSEDSEDSCSTLSDEDSTPHVSRSNSYGRSEDNTFNNPDESYNQQDDTTYDIYLHDERTLDIGTNLESAFIDNAKRNNDRREFDSFSCETPPGYEESLYRQRMLKLHNRSSSYIAPSPVNSVTGSISSALVNHVPEKVIEKQVELSAKAKAVFEESLRQYNEKLTKDPGSKETPPPLPPKTERPPLPPKQRSRRSTEQESSDDQTYVNSAELRHNRNRTKLNLNTSVNNHQQSSSDEKESTEFVYGSYYSGKGGTKVSVPVIQETKDIRDKVNPPSLPPKETRVAEVSETKQVKKKGVTSTRIVGTNVKPMKSVETQTDENDFYLMYPDERHEEESFNNTDSEYSPESNRSISPDYGGNGAPYFRTPDKAEYYLGANTLFERPVSAQSVGLRQAGRRKLEPVQSVPVRNHNDPVITGEINWSVSQLRTLFNQGLQSQNAEQTMYSDNVHDPGYRSPNRKQMLERRLNFHSEMAGGGNYSNMYNPDNQQTDSDQESYV